MRKFIMGAAAAVMVAGSSVAQAAPIADIRSGSPVAEAEGAIDTTELAVLGLALLLLALAAWGINDNDNEGLPSSP